jgi:hypothetical protein
VLLSGAGDPAASWAGGAATAGPHGDGPQRRPAGIGDIATSRRPDPHTLERHLAELKSILAGLRSGDTTADPLPVILVGPLPGGLIAAAYT